MTAKKPWTKFPKAMAEAIATGECWQPQDIASIRGVQAGVLVTLQDTGEQLQRAAAQLDTTNSGVLAAQLLGLIRVAVDRLNWLAKAGKLGNVARYCETWPINYAPDASTGASKWAAAKELYHQLHCGQETVLFRIAGQVSYDNWWTKLAVDGLKAALLAQNDAPWVDEQIINATLTVRATLTHARTPLTADYYLLPNDRVVVWPVWAEQCRNLPGKLMKDTVSKFLPVIRQLVRLYLIEDPQRMLEHLNAIAGKGVIKAWDSDVFNNDVMPRIKDALGALAARRD